MRKYEQGGTKMAAEHLYAHFFSPGHKDLCDVRVIIIDKTNVDRFVIYIMLTFSTFYPDNYVKNFANLLYFYYIFPILKRFANNFAILQILKCSFWMWDRFHCFCPDQNLVERTNCSF